MSKKNVIVLKHFEAPGKSGTYARLVCLSGDNKGLAYYLNSSRVVLGRADSVDIKIADIKSSREHAEIVKSGAKFIITDLGSHNGIIVNELSIKQHVLSDGDKIVIGRTVYKFSVLKVNESEKAKVAKNAINKKDKEDKSKNSDNKKKIYIVVVIIVGALLLFPSEEEKKEEKRARVKKRSELRESSIRAKQIKRKDKDKQEKMAIYFSRGLREFREKNYFRAMSEFEHALSWSPNDPLALFYMRKTKDALNKAVEEIFNRGRRDEDSLKYQNAAVSYCSVIRLLYRYPKDERYIDAEKRVKSLEEKMGLNEGELECIQKIK